MVKLKRTRINDGEVYVDYLYISENEWRVLEPRIPKEDNLKRKERKNKYHGLKLELVDLNAVPGDTLAPAVDDKPKLDAYEELRVKGEELFKEEKYSDALQYFNKASAIKGNSPFLKGRINKCVALIQDAVNKAKKDDKSDTTK